MFQNSKCIYKEKDLKKVFWEKGEQNIENSMEVNFLKVVVPLFHLDFGAQRKELNANC